MFVIRSVLVFFGDRSDGRCFGEDGPGKFRYLLYQDVSRQILLS